MRNPVAVAALVLAAGAAAGCSSWRAAAPSAAMRSADAREVFGDIEQLQFAKQVQVQLPARLAVSDVSSGADDDRRRRLAATVASLSEDTATWNDVGSLHVWNDERASGGTRFDAYRAAASRQHADLLLVTERVETVRRENTPLMLLRLLIVPIFLVPDTRLRTTVNVHTAAIDVRNGLVYATTDQHAESETWSTMYGRERAGREQADELFTSALPGLRETLARKLRVLEGTR